MYKSVFIQKSDFKNGLSVNIKADKLIAFTLAFISLLTLWAPYQGDSTISVGAVKYLIKPFAYVCSVFILMYALLKKYITYSGVLIGLSPIIYYMYNYLHCYDDGNVSLNILNILMILSFALVTDGYKVKAYCYFKSFLVVISAIGIICYILYILNSPVPYRVIDYYSLDGYNQYIDYGICYIYTNIAGSSVRLCGIFNEPGYLGTFIALILCIEDMNIKKKENIILLIAGFLSFSMAFAMLIFIYLIMKFSRKPKTLILLVVVILLYFFVLPKIKTGNQNIDGLLSRLVINENGLVGNNRTNARFDYIFDQTFHSSNIIFGNGSGYAKNIIGGSFASVKTYIIEHGLVGCLVFLGYLFFVALQSCKNNINCVFLVLCFFLSVYQRPNIFTMSYFIVLFGGIKYIQYNNELIIRES